MPKKQVKKKVKRANSKLESSSKSYSWIWYLVGALIIIAALFFVFQGMTGNAIMTGNAMSDSIRSTWTDYFQPVLEYLVGQNVNTGGDAALGTFGDFFSMALLIMLIVFGVVYLVLKSMPLFQDPDHTWILWTVSIAVTLLSVRFLTAEWLIAILLPYSTLGIAISAGIPFVLYFFVVSKMTSTTARRIAWIFFAVIFLYLWYDRTHDANRIILESGAYYGIYLWTVVLAFIMILFDGTFQGWRNKIDHEKANAMRKGPALAALDKLISDTHEAFGKDGTAYQQKYPPAAGVTGIVAYKNDIKELEARRKALLK